MVKRWVFKNSPEEEQIAALSASIRISPELSRILLQRNINSFDSARSFFRPQLSGLHDPFLMKDMEVAVERLIKAFQASEKILIYGDYDVDGTTAVALVYGFLRNCGANVSFYIPDRYAEGYGVSRKGINYAIEHDYSLIISLDCGVKSVELIKYASENGIDFIVCDHHKPDVLPEAVAILDPKRNDCPYPYKELSGCGVGYKMLQGFCRKMNLDESLLQEGLDLVAVSIACDIVPITGENRILTYFGLQKLNKEPRPGLKALTDISGYKTILDVQGVVFGIGPRINAAGRIAHAKAAVELLLTENISEAENVASLINDNNTIRRDFDISITEQALSMIQEELSENSRTTVLFRPDWHKGVIGIVASRCIEKFYRPTVILTESNNFATGSARSIAGFDLYEAISKCSDLLEQFGGHTHAAGLTMKIENIEAFRQKFEEVATELLNEEDLLPLIEIDGFLSLNKISHGFYNILRQMGPFGPGNMNPVFVTENLQDDGTGRLLKNKHLKLSVREDNSQSIEAIGFNMPEYFERISRGQRFDLCYTICENTWNGHTNLQLNIKDIKFRTN
jgi:single-stranded-DNA-specific exonuclease